MAPLIRIFRGSGRRAPGRGLKWAMLCGLCLFPLFAAEPAPQREVQAIFLLNLTRFVRWPDHAFTAEDSPLLIGVLPADPVTPLITDAARGEMAGKHPLAVRQLRSSADVEGCHLLFLPKTDMDSVARLATAARSKSILTVSDADGFFRLGGHVQFYTRGGQVRLRLDLKNLKQADLTPSSQLLRVSEVIQN